MAIKPFPNLVKGTSYKDGADISVANSQLKTTYTNNSWKFTDTYGFWEFNIYPYIDYNGINSNIINGSDGLFPSNSQMVSSKDGAQITDANSKLQTTYINNSWKFKNPSYAYYTNGWWSINDTLTLPFFDIPAVINITFPINDAVLTGDDGLDITLPNAKKKTTYTTNTYGFKIDDPNNVWGITEDITIPFIDQTIQQSYSTLVVSTVIQNLTGDDGLDITLPNAKKKTTYTTNTYGFKIDDPNNVWGITEDITIPFIDLSLSILPEGYSTLIFPVDNQILTGKDGLDITLPNAKKKTTYTTNTYGFLVDGNGPWGITEDINIPFIDISLMTLPEGYSTLIFPVDNQILTGKDGLDITLPNAKKKTTYTTNTYGFKIDGIGYWGITEDAAIPFIDLQSYSSNLFPNNNAISTGKDGVDIDDINIKKKITYTSRGWTFREDFIGGYWGIIENITIPFFDKQSYYTEIFPSNSQIASGKDGLDVTLENAQKKSTYTNNNWTFRRDSQTGYWAIIENNSLPFFQDGKINMVINGQLMPVTMQIRKNGKWAYTEYKIFKNGSWI